MKRLIFGDPESIALRDKAMVENIVNKLMKEVKCPYCGVKASHCYNHDIERGEFNFNFDCNPDCPNSFEYAEKHGFENVNAKTTFNSHGILLD